jgi:hypothetical protein
LEGLACILAGLFQVTQLNYRMEHITYKDFAESCLYDLMDLQNKFQNDYNLDRYESFEYSQATGLLTFTKADKDVNFKYIQVGTFSKSTSTWKWSWDNVYTAQKVKEKIYDVKDFGEKSNYIMLTEGCFDSCEEEACILTAIAAKVVNGMGFFRHVSDHLVIFMVLLEFIDSDSAQTIKDRYIECNEHEYRRRAFACRHLDNTTKVGFKEAFETYENMELSDEDDFQAWCDECERVRQKEGGWNENSMKFADIKIVCEQCYFDMKERNLGRR